MQQFEGGCILLLCVKMISKYAMYLFSGTSYSIPMCYISKKMYEKLSSHLSQNNFSSRYQWCWKDKISSANGMSILLRSDTCISCKSPIKIHRRIPYQYIINVWLFEGRRQLHSFSWWGMLTDCLVSSKFRFEKTLHYEQN